MSAYMKSQWFGFMGEIIKNPKYVATSCAYRRRMCWPQLQYILMVKLNFIEH